MACQLVHAHTHAHTHIHTLYRHTVGTRWQMSIIASMRTLTRAQPHSHTSPPPPSLTPSVSLCLSPPEDYTAGYLTPLLQKNVAWKSFTLSENTTIHLPPSPCSLVAPSLFLFHLLFVSPHFFPSQVFSGALQMEHRSRKPYPFVLCLPIQLHGHVGILKFRLM